MPGYKMLFQNIHAARYPNLTMISHLLEEESKVAKNDRYAAVMQTAEDFSTVSVVLIDAKTLQPTEQYDYFIDAGQGRNMESIILHMKDFTPPDIDFLETLSTFLMMNSEEIFSELDSTENSI